MHACGSFPIVMVICLVDLRAPGASPQPQNGVMLILSSLQKHIKYSCGKRSRMFLKMLGSHYMRINQQLSYFSNTGEIKVFVCKPDFNIAIFPGEKMLSFVVQQVKSMCLSSWQPMSKEWGKFFPFILYLRLSIKQDCLKGNGLKDNGQTLIMPVSEELRNCGISFGKLSAGDKTTLTNVTYLRSMPY